MITLLVIIFIITMIVLRIKSTPEEERDHQARYLGQEFADKEYYKTLAKREIKEEDKQLLLENNNSVKLAFQLGQTKSQRIKERAAKLAEQENK